MKRIGIALSIPSLNTILKKYRNKYNKWKGIDPHMTVYLSDYIGHDDENVKLLVRQIKVHSKKIVINKAKWNKRIAYLNVQNWSDYIDLKKTAIKTFGKEKYRNDMHITIGYQIPQEEYRKIMKDIDKHLPLTVEGSAFKIVIVNGDEAREYWIDEADTFEFNP